MRAIGYLLAYNVMFILPLLVVLVLLLRGLRLERLLAWSERHVIASKVMLGLFFLCLCLLTVL